MVVPVLKASFAFLRKYWIILLAIAALTKGISELISGPNNTVLPIPAGAIGSMFLLLEIIIGLAATVILQGIVAQLAYNSMQEGDKTVISVVKQILARSAYLAVIGLISFVLVILGFVLLIVPGIICLVLFSLVIPVAVVERRKVADVFNRSMNLVQGHFWEVLAVIIIVGLPTGLISLVIELFQNFTHPSLMLNLVSYVVDMLSSLFDAIVAVFIYLQLISDRAQSYEFASVNVENPVDPD